MGGDSVKLQLILRPPSRQGAFFQTMSFLNMFTDLLKHWYERKGREGFFKNVENNTILFRYFTTKEWVIDNVRGIAFLIKSKCSQRFLIDNPIFLP